MMGFEAFLTGFGYFLAALGLFIVFWGNYGMIILPDTLTRFHAGTKCGATGSLTSFLGLILIADGVDFTVKLLVLIAITIITSPLIGHILGLSYIKYREYKAGRE